MSLKLRIFILCGTAIFSLSSCEDNSGDKIAYTEPFQITFSIRRLGTQDTLFKQTYTIEDCIVADGSKLPHETIHSSSEFIQVNSEYVDGAGEEGSIGYVTWGADDDVKDAYVSYVGQMSNALNIPNNDLEIFAFALASITEARISLKFDGTNELIFWPKDAYIKFSTIEFPRPENIATDSMVIAFSMTNTTSTSIVIVKPPEFESASVILPGHSRYSSSSFLTSVPNLIQFRLFGFKP